MATQPSEQELRKGEELLTELQLREFVFDENERLNRLIRNLYIKFRLDRYPAAELYDHICREVAQYFHADACSLLLVRHKREKDPTGTTDLRTCLELVGAFGPWEEALHPKKTRRKQVVQYDLY